MRVACLTFLFMAGGCAAADATSIVFELRSSDVVIPSDADGLRLEADAADGTQLQISVRLDSPFPQTLTIVPATERSLSPMTVRVWLMRGNEPVTQRVVSASFVSRRLTRIPVTFEAACLGVICPDGIDCAGGRCIGASPDAGPPDAGPFDGGVDAGDDAGSPEVCGGGDEDGDGLIDEGLPCVGSIVISELATGRVGLPTDELVELFNTTMHEVDLGGVTLSYRGPVDTAFRRLMRIPPGSTVPPYGHFLIVAEGYAGLVPADVPRAWGEDLDAVTGAVKIAFRGDLDQVGWGGGDAEGVALTAPWDGTYERMACTDSTAESMEEADAELGNGLDCENNAADFILRARRDPQNASSRAEALCSRLCAR